MPDRPLVNEDNGQFDAFRFLRDRAQYVIALVVVASLLLVAGFPIFVVLFFGIFAYFMAKMFSSGNRSQTREIFEFYLTAHEMLRDGIRKWYGFEVNEAIARGERILRSMPHAPPLVHFALGALYQKVGDHSNAVKHLAYISEDPKSFESSVVYPTVELRNYVNVLRKIEREPSEAPLTSAAVRGLERARKLRGDAMLADAKENLAKLELAKLDSVSTAPTDTEPQLIPASFQTPEEAGDNVAEVDSNGDQQQKRKSRKRTESDQNKYASRKPISEVLHDIYDRNVQ